LKSFTHSKFTHSLILYSDRVFVGEKLQAATLSIKDDKITAVHIGQKLEAAQDFSGNVIMPGAITYTSTNPDAPIGKALKPRPKQPSEAASRLW